MKLAKVYYVILFWLISSLKKLFQHMLHLTEIKTIALAEAYKKDKWFAYIVDT